METREVRLDILRKDGETRPMPEVRVTCALIEEDSRLLVAQRAPGKAQAGKWEFPGGKIDPGETPEDCLKREIREELGCEIDVGEALTPVLHAYSTDGGIILMPFRCRIRDGSPMALEHAAIAWVPSGKLLDWDLADADRPVVVEYRAKREQERAAALETRRPGASEEA